MCWIQSILCNWSCYSGDRYRDVDTAHKGHYPPSSLTHSLHPLPLVMSDRGTSDGKQQATTSDLPASRASIGRVEVTQKDNTVTASPTSAAPPTSTMTIDPRLFDFLQRQEGLLLRQQERMDRFEQVLLERTGPTPSAVPLSGVTGDLSTPFPARTRLSSPLVNPPPMAAFNSPLRPIRPSTTASKGEASAATPFVRQRGQDEEEHGHTSGRGKIPEPAKFRGTDDDKINARQWLSQADAFLSLAHGGRSDRQLVQIFGLMLDKPASTWFSLSQQVAQQSGVEWKLQQVYDAFLMQYAGQDTDSLLKVKMEGLRFSRSKDFTTFVSQWQDLAAQRFPREWAMGQREDSRVLGDSFSNLIMRDDWEVWEKANELVRDGGLNDWKVAVQHAIVVLRRREQHKQSRHSTSSHSHTAPRHTATVRVNAMQEEDSEDSRGEGESEEANKLQAKARKQKKGRVDKTERLYTDEEYKKVLAKRLCVYCGQPDHIAKYCPDRQSGKPRTKATAEALNA